MQTFFAKCFAVCEIIITFAPRLQNRQNRDKGSKKKSHIQELRKYEAKNCCRLWYRKEVDGTIWCQS